jgi:hypothetical protein
MRYTGMPGTSSPPGIIPVSIDMMLSALPRKALEPAYLLFAFYTHSHGAQSIPWRPSHAAPK